MKILVLLISHMANRQVIVRALMNNSGYGGKPTIGLVKTGFRQTDLEKYFGLYPEEESLPIEGAF